MHRSPYIVLAGSNRARLSLDQVEQQQLYLVAKSELIRDAFVSDGMHGIVLNADRFPDFWVDAKGNTSIQRLLGNEAVAHDNLLMMRHILRTIAAAGPTGATFSDIRKALESSDVEDIKEIVGKNVFGAKIQFATRRMLVWKWVRSKMVYTNTFVEPNPQGGKAQIEKNKGEDVAMNATIQRRFWLPRFFSSNMLTLKQGGVVAAHHEGVRISPDKSKKRKRIRALAPNRMRPRVVAIGDALVQLNRNNPGTDSMKSRLMHEILGFGVSLGSMIYKYIAKNPGKAARVEATYKFRGLENDQKVRYYRLKRPSSAQSESQSATDLRRELPKLRDATDWEYNMYGMEKQCLQLIMRTKSKGMLSTDLSQKLGYTTKVIGRALDKMDQLEIRKERVGKSTTKRYVHSGYAITDDLDSEDEDKYSEYGFGNSIHALRSDFEEDLVLTLGQIYDLLLLVDPKTSPQTCLNVINVLLEEKFIVKAKETKAYGRLSKRLRSYFKQQHIHVYALLSGDMSQTEALLKATAKKWRVGKQMVQPPEPFAAAKRKGIASEKRRKISHVTPLVSSEVPHQIASGNAKKNDEIHVSASTAMSSSAEDASLESENDAFMGGSLDKESITESEDKRSETDKLSDLKRQLSGSSIASALRNRITCAVFAVDRKQMSGKQARRFLLKAYKATKYSSADAKHAIEHLFALSKLKKEEYSHMVRVFNDPSLKGLKKKNRRECLTGVRKADARILRSFSSCLEPHVFEKSSVDSLGNIGGEGASSQVETWSDPVSDISSYGQTLAFLENIVSGDVKVKMKRVHGLSIEESNYQPDANSVKNQLQMTNASFQWKARQRSSIQSIHGDLSLAPSSSVPGVSPSLRSEALQLLENAGEEGIDADGGLIISSSQGSFLPALEALSSSGDCVKVPCFDRYRWLLKEFASPWFHTSNNGDEIMVRPWTNLQSMTQDETLLLRFQVCQCLCVRCST